MRTPGVLDFFQKKKFQVRAELKVAKIYVVFQQKLFNSQSLSTILPLPPLSLNSLSLSHPQLTRDDAQWTPIWTCVDRKSMGALIWTCDFILFLQLPFLFTGHLSLSLSLLGLKAEAPFSLYLPFQTHAAYFSLSLSSRFTTSNFFRGTLRSHQEIGRAHVWTPVTG